MCQDDKIHAGDIALNKLGAELKQLCFVSTAWYAYNSKIKRNKKKKGFER